MLQCYFLARLKSPRNSFITGQDQQRLDGAQRPPGAGAKGDETKGATPAFNGPSARVSGMAAVRWIASQPSGSQQSRQGSEQATLDRTTPRGWSMWQPKAARPEAR